MKYYHLKNDGREANKPNKTIFDKSVAKNKIKSMQYYDKFEKLEERDTPRF